jgi:hypothetical protein
MVNSRMRRTTASQSIEAAQSSCRSAAMEYIASQHR